MNVWLEFFSEGKHYRISILQVRRARAAKRNCFLSLFSGEVIKCPFSLKEIYEKGKASGFILAQRCYVINPEAVIRLHYHQHHYAVLDNGEEVYVTEEAYNFLKKYQTVKLQSKRPPQSEGGFFPLYPN